MSTFFFFQRDTALSKKDSNVSIHKKLLSQIVEYEHTHVKVSSFQIFIQSNLYYKVICDFASDVLSCNSLYFNYFFSVFCLFFKIIESLLFENGI